jgi:hypothetical protein
VKPVHAQRQRRARADAGFQPGDQARSQRALAGARQTDQAGDDTARRM